MSGEHRNPSFSSWAQPGVVAHPDSPAGGSGPGFCTAADPRGDSWAPSSVPHPDSPTGSRWLWHVELPHLIVQDRAAAVYDAITSAPRYVPEEIVEATGQELDEIVSGLVPGLVLMLAVVAATTALGALAGFAIGALAFGTLAAPGAAIGAEAGLDFGVAILGYLGLSFLVFYIGERLIEGSGVAGDAVQSAWRSVDERGRQAEMVDHAARRLALAVGLVFRGVLQGLVAFLLAKGTAAAASRVPELVTRLRASRLGAGFAEWIERNWSRLLKEPKLRDEPVRGSEGGAAEKTGTETAAAKQATTEKAAAEKAAAEKAAAEKAAAEKAAAEKAAAEKAAAEKTAAEKAAAAKVTAPIDFDGHITNAEIKPNGNVVGGHSTATGQVRIIPGTQSAPNAQGVYKAKIEIADPANPGNFLQKTNNGGESTMFPDSWSADRLKVEVDSAWQNRTVNGNKWTGVTPSGVRVEGYVNPKTTVYPKL